MISVRNLFLSIKNPQTKYKLMKHFEPYNECYEKLGLYFESHELKIKYIY